MSPMRGLLISTDDFKGHMEMSEREYHLESVTLFRREEPVMSCITYIYCNDTDRLRFTYWV
jgi:hypothetical protein